ncbi:MAG: SLC13 family permease [Vicinamibacterales bacterium]
MPTPWPASHLVTLGVFALVYLGMILGGLPRLSLDRTGIALLAAIAVVGAGVLTPEQAAAREQHRLGATLIGNPQNMLVGQVLALPFADHTRHALPPVVIGLIGLWALLAREVGTHVAADAPAPPAVSTVDPPPFDRWQTAKGLAVAVVLIGIFLATDWPRDVAALVGAGVLLLSQRFHSSTVMGLIDWQLLVLFMGLFVVNHAMALTGLAPAALAWLAAHGLGLGTPGALATATAVLSNLVSNVPAVMLLLPAAQAAPRPEAAGEILALVSTFAGNLVVVGSIANLIVVDAAHKAGVDIDWRRHARMGMPVTPATLVVAVLWMAILHAA